MSILSDIFHKIFPASHPAVTQSAPAQPGATPSTAPSATSATSPATADAARGGNAPGAGAPAATPAINTNVPPVDVTAILDNMAHSAGQPLNWRTSIVDLLKLLHLDSSLEARKELARELHYSGDTSDSAAMNVWLHQQVMLKLAANGGKVPADLAA
jgi:hypothetical protein